MSMKVYITYQLQNLPRIMNLKIDLAIKARIDLDQSREINQKVVIVIKEGLLTNQKSTIGNINENKLSKININ